jgi:hypothetical protein
MIKRSLWILALTAALAACSSGVKLSEVPVEDKNASASASRLNRCRTKQRRACCGRQSGCTRCGASWRECGVF